LDFKSKMNFYSCQNNECGMKIYFYRKKEKKKKKFC
jgi:hypothetical protein